MDEDVALAQVLRAYVTTGEPSLAPATQPILVAGRRARRIQRGLWTGVAVVVTVLVTAGLTGGIGMLRGLAGPERGGGPAVPLPACPTPDLTDPAERVTCYLVAAVPALLPQATYQRLYGPAGSDPLRAAPGGELMDGYQASALVRDADGTGSLLLSLGRAAGLAGRPSEADCRSKGMCHIVTGPHGETVYVYDSQEPGGGRHGVTLYVYSGHTLILATMSNVDESGGDGEVTRPEPPLTTEQLIQLATAPDLVIYP